MNQPCSSPQGGPAGLRVLCIVLLCLAGAPLQAQTPGRPIVALQPRIDSLEARLPSAAGPDRLDVLIPLVAFYADNDTERALTLAWEGLGLLRVHPDPLREARLRAGKAQTHYVRSDYDSLRAETGRMLALAEATGDRKPRAAALTLQANAAKVEGTYDRALAEVTEALAIYEALGDRAGQSDALIVQAGIQARQGTPYRATANRALALAEELGDGRLMALALFELGKDAKESGDVAAFLATSEQALAASKAVPYRRGVVIALEDIAQAYRLEGRQAKVREVILQALERNEALGDRRVTARLLSSLALYHHVRGEFTEAVNYYEQSIRQFEAVGVENQAAFSQANLGMVQWQAGDPAVGLTNLIASADRLAALGNTDAFYPLAIMGYLYEERGDYDEAIGVLERGLAATEKPENQANMLPILAHSYLGVGREEEAAEVAEAFLEVTKILDSKPQTGSALALLAEIEAARGNEVAALAANTGAVTIYQEIEFEMELATLYLTRAGLFERLAQPDSALQAAQAALDQARKTGQPLQARNSYETLARLYEAQGDHAAALGAHKRFKALQDSLFTADGESVVAELQQQYKTQEQQQHIEILQQAQEIQRLFLFGLIGGVVLLALIAFLVYTRYRLKHRAHAALAEAHTQVQAHEAQLEAQNLLLREHETQLESQNERLRELDGLKSRFFANISHEFRTPLTLILGPLDDALDGVGAPPSPGVLQLMRRNARRLLRLINQLLDLARLEAGGLHLNAVQTDLDRLLRRLSEAFHSRAERQGVTLLYDGTDGALGAVDRDKIEKVAMNLISNALKFTPAGGKVRVVLRKQAAPEPGQPDEVTLTVEDTGHGIPAADQPRIFDRFYQVDGSATRAHEGSGIGLALVKELVELHGGTVTLESTEGFGTTFTVHLPLVPVEEEGVVQAPDDHSVTTLVEADDTYVRESQAKEILGGDGVEEGDAAGAPEPAPALAARQATVLVVEDNRDMRAYLKGLLLNAGYAVVEAPDGEAGLEAARQHQPDLVISDVMMPHMDGFALCAALKDDPALGHIPVVLVTARATEADRIEGLTHQADDYLPKPFRAEELLLRTENLIEIRRRLRSRYQETVRLGASEVVVERAEAAFVREVRAVIEAQLGNSSFTVEHLAAEVGLSVRQLYRRMEETTGMTPAGYVRMLRLERAAQLLSQSYGGVAEVAYAVGFNDANYFSRLFKQTHGMTPSAYVASLTS